MLPLTPEQLATLSKLRADYAKLSELITCLEFVRDHTSPLPDIFDWKATLSAALSIHRTQQMQCRIKIILIQRPDATLYDIDQL